MVQPLWKTTWQLSLKVNICSKCDPAILLLGLFLKEISPYVHKKPCTKKFYSSTLLNIAKLETTQTFINSRMDKLWHTYPVEYYTAISEWTYGVCINMDETHVLQNTQDSKQHGVWVNLYAFLGHKKLTCGDGCQNSGHLWETGHRRRRSMRWYPAVGKRVP